MSHWAKAVLLKRGLGYLVRQDGKRMVCTFIRHGAGLNSRNKIRYCFRHHLKSIKMISFELSKKYDGTGANSRNKIKYCFRHYLESVKNDIFRTFPKSVLPYTFQKSVEKYVPLDTPETMKKETQKYWHLKCFKATKSVKSFSYLEQDQRWLQPRNAHAS